jgi:2-polyprenyl-6-hydroxyphenyl methylase / 3-demethylubiquinone-9 3-methyltransferase
MSENFGTTIDQNEVEKFSAISEEWWDEKGKFKPLHKFNPIRISYLREKIIKYFNLDNNSKTPFSGLKILDIGCGGGLLCEPLNRLGAEIVGIDAAEKNIKIARLHSEKSSLNMDYRHIDVEELAKSSEKFDVVLAMEVIEHVADVNHFIAAIAGCAKKDSLVFIATINRTAKSFLSAIIGAEYILRWLPAGTHNWKKFLKPSEVSKIAASHHLQLLELDGFEYNLLNDRWKNSANLDINYITMFKKI